MNTRIGHLIVSFLFGLVLPRTVPAQVCEWQLANVVYSNTDPDGAGPALGTVSFDLRVHTVSGTINNVNVLSTGWSWQTAKAMVPASPGCSILSAPANVTMLPPFSTAGFSFTTVNECNVIALTAGGQSFNRRVTGTLDGPGITLTTAWVDVFRVTLWTLTTTAPEGGYAIIHSSNGGSPSPFGTYSLSDNGANEYIVNSLSFSAPVPLGTPVAALPDLAVTQFFTTTQVAPGGSLDEVVGIRNVGAGATAAPIVINVTNYSPLTGLSAVSNNSPSIMIGFTPFTLDNANWSVTSTPSALTFTSNPGITINPGTSRFLGIRINRAAGARGSVTHSAVISSGTGGGETPVNNNAISNTLLKN